MFVIWSFARNPRFIKFLSRFYAPFLGTGVRVTKLSPDYKECEICLKLSWYNRNYVGTQFGGSMFVMTDPFYTLMLINILGSDYMVWDKAACIEFVKPGKTELSAEFKLTDEFVNEIIKKTSDGSPLNLKFDVDIVDKQGEVVAKVDKTVYVRKKKGR